jgi:hypothetical protein
MGFRPKIPFTSGVCTSKLHPTGERKVVQGSWAHRDEKGKIVLSNDLDNPPAK